MCIRDRVSTQSTWGQQTLLINLNFNIKEEMSRYTETTTYSTTQIIKGQPKQPAQQKQALNDDELNDMREAFMLFDQDGSGTIDPREVKDAMKSLGFDEKNPTIYNIVADMEKLKGPIDFQTFMDYVKDRLGSDDTDKGLRTIFSLYDDDKTGSINIYNLKRVAKELGETMNEQELLEMLGRIAQDKQNITYEEFADCIKRRKNK
eukprot:TRINITY_DN2634_c0_g1_i1.p2 TRINITY_DN2634_c0_g1~~TRINITY_DN2634_c0_g1_i1.p2  ORF type:complete len:205 (-),score=70.34 TRINITY_DN2634_c0_g1_i1:3-617(-)